MPPIASRRSTRAGAAVLLGALLVMAVMAVPGRAMAADSPAPQPPVPQLVPQDPGPAGYFEYRLAPGQIQDGSVTIRNPAQTAATFALYPTDASTSTATGVIYGGLGGAVTATGVWVSMGPATLNLGPGQSQTVAFHVSVPTGATPGDHVAGIAAQNPQSTTQHAGVTGAKDVGVALDVSTRVVIAVVVHVPGPAVAGLSLGPPALHAENGNRQVVDLPMVGTGQLLIKPHLSVSLRACGGSADLAHLDRQLDTFVPGTSIVYEWPLGTLVLQPACYTVVAAATLGATPLGQVTGDVTVSAAEARVHPVAGPLAAASPVPHHRSNGVVVALGLAGVVGLIVLIIALARSRRHRRELERELARLSSGGGH